MQNVTSTTSESLKALSKPFSQRVWQSFMSSLGSIVFGMEDGTVSIFGLVFGVAASATSSQVVLLAGATGAISAAVSMMAGTYLDVSTERDRAHSAIAIKQREIEQGPEQAAQEVRDQLLGAGFTPQDAQTVVTILQRTPGALLKDEIAFRLAPVLPFVFLPLGAARTVSLVVTTALLLLLGVGRGIIGHKNIAVTALQTLAIAAASWAAGLLVGSLVSRQIAQ